VPAGASATGRRPVRLLLVAVVLLVILASAWALRLWSARDLTPTSSDAIAVLPFAVRGSEAVRYLGDGAVSLLAAALDGAGALRPVDTRATFAAVAEAGGTVPDPQHGDRIASRLGAGMFVLGSVVEAGGRLQIEAAVYRADPDCARQLLPAATPARCRTPEPMVSAVVSGAADSVFGLVDRLAARLLGGLGDPNADRLLRTASLTTTSLPAFKDYLQGEELMRAGQFERAAEEYLAAIALDSTFAVAHYRLALAREWAPLPGIEDAATAAARHAERLSSRDRALLEALSHWRAGDATQAARTYRTVLARYPDDIDAWFQLGEIQFHHGPLLGNPLGDSEEAWRRVLSHEPRNLFALTHLARLLVVDGRTAAVDSLLAPFTADEQRNDRRLEEILILRAVARGDTAEARDLAHVVRQGESPATWRVAVFLTAFTPDPAAMRVVIDELVTDYPNPALRADLHWFASMLDLAGGRLAAAESARTRAVEAERALPAEQRRWGFDPVTEWYAVTLPVQYSDSTLVRARRRAASFEVPPTAGRPPFENVLAIGMPIRVEPLRQYTLGLLSLRLGDTIAAAAAAVRLRRIAESGDANTLVRDLDRGLRAHLAWRARRADEALGLLEALESRDSQGDIAVTPFVTRANERFLRGEILASLGRDEDALRWFASLGAGSVTEIPLQALSHLRQGEISDRLGRRREAARHYARVLELWRDADPELQSLVDTAQGRLARLESGAASS
jgi:tetratricopeptide (TPR) repeat protein